MEKFTENEFVQFFIKILFPALIGVGIRIGVEMRKEKTKVSFFNVCLSMFTGAGGAYLFNGMIQETIQAQYQPIAVAFIAITTDKINNLAITTAKIADGAVTRAKYIALGQQVSSSSGIIGSA